MLTIPASANSSRRSLERTSPVLKPTRSSRSSAPRKSAPRGTATVSGGVTAAPRLPGAGCSLPERGTKALPPANCQLSTRSPRPLLGSLGDMHPLDVHRDPTRRQRSPEAPNQLVVSPAAAEREAHGGVVQLEHGARVVAELAHQPQV